ncbi:MAG: tRNA-dihydrouridine synthase [Planctomycetota bacterium]
MIDGSRWAHLDAENAKLGVPLSIGPVALTSNLLLAPVAKYCDLAWRVTCREVSGAAVGLACTDLLSPHGLLRGNAQSLDLAATNEADSPIGMQLYGGEADILAEGAVWAVRHGADVIDINMGCPVDKVTKKDGGSKLLCDPARTVDIATRIVEAVDHASAGRVPVTAKVRLGWSCDAIVAPALARRLEGIGIAMITVHGRTTEQKFKGEVDLAGIREVVGAVERIPVIGNGDVTQPEDVVTMMRTTGCAGVMIGRGSFSRPWLFERGWAAERGDEVRSEPTLEDKVEIIRRYFELMCRYRDERYAMGHIRRRITWFGKAMGPCKPLKEAVRNAGGAGEVHRLLDRFAAGELRVFGPRDKTATLT